MPAAAVKRHISQTVHRGLVMSWWYLGASRLLLTYWPIRVTDQRGFFWCEGKKVLVTLWLIKKKKKQFLLVHTQREPYLRLEIQNLHSPVVENFNTSGFSCEIFALLKAQLVSHDQREWPHMCTCCCWRGRQRSRFLLSCGRCTRVMRRWYRHSNF